MEFSASFSAKIKNGILTGPKALFKIPYTLQMVGIARFELATFCPPDKRANQAALYPDYNIIMHIIFCNISEFQLNASSKIKKNAFLRILRWSLK